eukprot:4147967-Lingulodinium_polyedra.AAC.1
MAPWTLELTPTQPWPPPENPAAAAAPPADAEDGRDARNATGLEPPIRNAIEQTSKNNGATGHLEKSIDNQGSFTHFRFIACPVTSESLRALAEWSATEEVAYLTFAFKVCPRTQKPHLQGRVEVREERCVGDLQQRPIANSWHWEGCRLRASRAERACDPSGRYFESGVDRPQRCKSGAIAEEEGQLIYQLSAILQPRPSNTWRRAMAERTSCPHSKRCLSWTNAMFKAKTLVATREDLDVPGFRWQGAVVRFFLGTRADKRTVHWFVDSVGGRGKSELVKCLAARLDACPVMRTMQSTACMYQGQRICVADIAKGQTFTNYEGLALLKHGLI